MIERAGYPSIAASVDEALLQQTLPEIERRSFELVDLNKGGDPKAELTKEIESLCEKVAAL